MTGPLELPEYPSPENYEDAARDCAADALSSLSERQRLFLVTLSGTYALLAISQRLRELQAEGHQ